MTYLITGAAGFIGYHLSARLLRSNIPVVGIDNFNDYYDPLLKESRRDELFKISLSTGTKFKIIEADIENKHAIDSVFGSYSPSKVINLAAQAGVRYSLTNPSAYIQANLVGFANILEACRHNNVNHLIYASSSSVYGGNTLMPFSENHSVDHPVSLYAASKKANELMAHTYSHLFDLPTTGLRFFTVYGPWGRPDMALFLFTRAILEGKPIDVFNYGKMTRDFTYIDDIVESIFRLLDKPATPDPTFNSNSPTPSTSFAPYKIFNIGNSNPVSLMTYIQALENALGISAQKRMLPMQPGDVPSTSADTSSLEKWIDFRPNTSVEEGIASFVQWYRNFYNV